MTKQNDIADAFATEVNSALGITCVRRYAPSLDKSDLADGRYLVVPASAEQELKRGIEDGRFEIDFGYQITVPVGIDPTDDIGWLDSQADKVQAVLDLFRSGDEVTPRGPLIDKLFAGAEYMGWTHSPIYRPDILRDHGIFTSVVRFNFRLPG